ncbi:MAG: PKD domain-containing protein [Saprospiraceae bacterium]|nr:PKD domain-containing protein [Saprospiraceae bacterium]
MPSANSRLIQLALNPLNDNELWIAFVNGADGKKVYKTSDSGANWTNLTTPALNGERVHHIVHIGGSNGSIYAFSDKTVYYRNTAMADWMPTNEGLPDFISAQSARPFYRDGKIRLASYGKGIWESQLIDTLLQPIAKAMVDKLTQTVICQIDSFYFEDYSILNHAGAGWSWTFESGEPATSTLRNPTVYFGQPGTYLVTLTITDGLGQTSADSIYVAVENYDIPSTLQEGFQANFPPTGFSVQRKQWWRVVFEYFHRRLWPKHPMRIFRQLLHRLARLCRRPAHVARPGYCHPTATHLRYRLRTLWLPVCRYPGHPGLHRLRLQF